AIRPKCDSRDIAARSPQHGDRTPERHVPDADDRRVPPRRRRQATAVGTEAEIPAGPMLGICHREYLLDFDDTIERVDGGQQALIPRDAEDPEAVAIERQGRDLVEPGRDAPPARIAGRVIDPDPSHPPAAGVKPAAIRAERQPG